MGARRSHVVLIAAAALIAASCGGSGDDSSDEQVDISTTEAVTESSTEATEPTTTVAPDVTQPTEPEDSGAISSYTDVQPAVIQIVATGSLRDPEVGVMTTAGRGSGFIISPDGLAVTNNHVVTGAATLEVFVGGDDSKGYNASIIGVSECNDLALIRIDSREPLPYLEWSSEPPTVGTEIFAAGFPLGDPEFTMTRGIVAKANADGDTSWASIDYTIEHDANTQPGNSGGPIVDTDGHVVGVHYAGGSVTNTAQFFAISAELAQRVVERLHDGDFESLGINGSAVLDEEAGLSGVWVAGTAPGSPASNTGILPGDIVLELNGLPLATDGTMKDYCDVIRTSGDRPIHVKVLRYDTQEVLEGEINGELPLEQVFSFAQEIDDEVDVADEPGVAYTGTQTLVDDSGTITVDVPAEWAEVDTSPLELDDGSNAPWIAASPSLDAIYGGTYDAPGMFMASFPLVTAADIPGHIADFAPLDGECATTEPLTDYDDGAFVGQYGLWSDCGGVGAVIVILIANASNDAGSVVVGVQLLTEVDFDALDTIMGTFNFV